jgi:hypothetical protein
VRLRPTKQSGDMARTPTAVPRGMQVQLERLFGAKSSEAKTTTRTPAQWRRTLKKVLQELDRYVAENVDTDDLHHLILLSGLAAADESLKGADFWPGYVEGITRFALTLLGDYPDHRKRKTGRRADDHYNLGRLRSVQWVQSRRQRLNTLLAVGAVGFPELSAKPRDVLNDFRRRYGFKPSQDDFLEWYRKNMSKDYAAVFR